MKVLVLKFVQDLEIAWGFTWALFLLIYYFGLILNLHSSNFRASEYILQIIFIIASVLSLLVFILKKTTPSNKILTENDFIAEAGRVVFPILNLVYYLLDLFENTFLKLNFSYMWLILPWLLWLPIIFEISSTVKQEFSWIK
jgi:hypothetical protein